MRGLQKQKDIPNGRTLRNAADIYITYLPHNFLGESKFETTQTLTPTKGVKQS